MEKKLINIDAIENDGIISTKLSMWFEILKDDIDIVDAIKKAATEFVNTDNGIRVYGRNRGLVDWSVFWTCVPNSICEEHGFKKVKLEYPKSFVDLRENLVRIEEVVFPESAWTELKRTMMLCGNSVLEEFLGERICDGFNKAIVNDMLDETMAEMTTAKLLDFYRKYI